MTSENIRVLLIDDNETDREAVFRHIYNVFCVLEAKTGREGLETVKESKPACVLLDYRLPDVDGLELLKRFVQQQIPVVMLTGQGNEELAAQAMKLGAEDYLPKSMLTKQGLTRAVANAIEKFNLRRRLEDQQRDITDFVAFASDEIKSPLREISAATESLRREPSADPSRIEAICASVTQLNALIDAMVEYTQVVRLTGELETVDLEQCLATATAAVRGDVEASGAEITSGRMPIVKGRAAALSEVFQNLIRNAIKSAVQLPPHIRTFSELNNNVWTISLTNNHVEASSGDPGGRVRDATGAPQPVAGLGLVTCANIIRQHGGRIWVEHDPSGTTFHFTLPKYQSL